MEVAEKEKLECQRSEAVGWFIEDELLKNYCGCGECCRNYKSKGEERMNSWLTRDQSETLHVSRQFSLKHSRFWAGLSRPLHRMGSSAVPLSITQCSCLFCSANCLNYNYKKLARLSLDGVASNTRIPSEAPRLMARSPRSSDPFGTSIQSAFLDRSRLPGRRSWAAWAVGIG